MQSKTIISFLFGKDSIFTKLMKFKRHLLRYYIRPSILKYPPIKLQVELTNKCNLNCKICARHWISFKQGSMSNKLLQKIKDVIPKISELVLFGYGESLLHPNFFELVDQAKSNNKRVSFFTNGTLINRQTARKLVQKKVDLITFSLDGVDKKTFELIRQKADLDKIIDGINLINKFKEKYGFNLPRLEINFVLTRYNAQELPDMVNFAKKFKFEHVEVSYPIILSNKLKKYAPFDLNLIPLIEKAQKIAFKNKIILDIPHISGKKLRCESPWTYSYIRWDGTVQICCFSDKIVAGNLNKQSFKEIWNSPAYKNLRKLIKRQDYFLDDCQTCIARLKNVKLKNLQQIYTKTQKREKY